MLCHPKDLRNHCAKACTHSPYNLLGLGIRGYGKEVSMATWWARTTPANHCQVAPSKRRDLNGKLLTGPRTDTGYVTKRSFGWLPWQLRTITLFRISQKPHPTTNLFNSWGTHNVDCKTVVFFAFSQNWLSVGQEPHLWGVWCERKEKRIFSVSPQSRSPFSASLDYSHVHAYAKIRTVLQSTHNVVSS